MKVVGDNLDGFVGRFFSSAAESEEMGGAKVLLLWKKGNKEK